MVSSASLANNPKSWSQHKFQASFSLRLKILSEGSPAYLLDPILAARAEVEAGVDPGVGIRLCGLQEALERPRDAREWRPAGHAEGNLILAEKACADRGGGATGDTVRRRVVRNRRCVEIRLPGRISRCGIVAVRVRGADGGDRAPKIVDVAGIKSGDEGESKTSSAAACRGMARLAKTRKPRPAIATFVSR